MADISLPQRRGIALDMDGVITDSMHFHVEAWLYAFKHYDVDVDADWIYLLEGVLGTEVIDRTLEKYQRTLSIDERQTLYQIKTDHFRTIFRVLEIPGIHALIDLVHSCKYAVSVVTGSSREVVSQSLAQLGLGDRTFILVSSDDVTRGKPSPEPYLQALSAMQTAPHATLVVENAPAGVESARSAGLYCIAVETTLPRSALLRADQILPDLDAVATALRTEFDISQGLGPWRFDQL